MAYKQKYYFETIVDGHTNRLEIYQKDDTSTPMTAKYLGAVQGWSIGLVGSGGVIDPIIKSQCSITLVDAPERNSSTIKAGNYEEFYTSDATFYRVVVKTDGVERWTGYITPDSFQEDLSYHSTVNLTARDNIGHLQDIDFSASGDEYGMISVRNLISEAINKTEGMSWDDDYHIPMMANNGDITSNVLDTYLNIEMFEEKNWYEALEMVLNSLGLCLRWNDHNCFVVYDIAHQAEGLNYSSPEDPRNITICNESGTRELDPAYKKIIDTLNYEQGNILEAKLGENDYQTASATIAGHSVSGHKPKLNTKWLTTGQMLTLNPFVYKANPYFGLNFRTEDNIFLPCVYENQWSANNYISKSVPIVYGGNTLKITYKFNSQLFTGNDTTGYMNASMPQVGLSNYVFHKWAIKGVISGNTRYYNASKGKWQGTLVWNQAVCQSSDTDAVNSMAANVECNVQIDTNVTSLEFMLSQFFIGGDLSTLTYPDLLWTPDIVQAGKCYCRLSNFQVTIADIADYDYSKTTTIYNESNNVVLNRTPELGQVPQLPTSKVIKNGIYLKAFGGQRYPAAVHWTYLPSYNTAQYDLPVWIAQEILTLYNTPLSIISGEVIDLTENDPRFNAVWVWKNRRFVLVAGTLDLTSNHITGAQFREICEYEDIWDNQEGEHEAPVGPTTLSVSPSTIEADFRSQTVQIHITSTGSSYSLSTSDDWITLGSDSGTGSQTLNVQIDVNEDSVPRIGTVYIGHLYVTITQNPSEANSISFESAADSNELTAGE